MEFHFKVTTILTLTHVPGEKPKHKFTDLVMDPSDNLNRDGYFSGEDLPNKVGAQAITETLIEGLIANIHYTHQNGIRDSAEHLRDIIRKLEDGFVRIGNISHPVEKMP